MLPSFTLLPIPVDHLQVLDQMQPPSMPLSLLLSPRMLEDQQVHWHHKQRDELLLLVLLSLLLLLDIWKGCGLNKWNWYWNLNHRLDQLSKLDLGLEDLNLAMMLTLMKQQEKLRALHPINISLRAALCSLRLLCCLSHCFHLCCLLPCLSSYYV